MKTSLFNYNLPKELIAQYPCSPRDHSRLLVYPAPLDHLSRRSRDKKQKVTQRCGESQDKIIHDKFYNLKKYLKPGDVLVFNNTKVFPARLILQKESGGKIEIFLLQDLNQGRWECLVGGKVKPGLNLLIGNKNICKIIEKNKDGNWIVKFNLNKKDFDKFLERYGQTPTPPYIKTPDSKLIRKKYQTVYAKNSGSVAAPTAGLHFTKRLLKGLNKFGVQLEFITLHVGLATFAPIKTQKIEDHQLHAEYAILDKQTCERLNRAKRAGRRIIAVGTTSLRVLEAVTRQNKQNKLKPIRKWINLFIYPSYKFKFIDGMITNFHLPQSSLLILVSALVGRQKILEIYQSAIKKKYRFYSFGDAMLIID